MNKIRILKQEVLTIGKGIVVSNDSFMQMKNITRVWFGKSPVEVPYLKAVIAFFIGTGLLPTPFSAGGIILIIVAIAVLSYYIYLRSHYCLSFELSSGQIYAFTALQREFLEESYKEVKKIMNDKKGLEKGVKINFNDCKINMIGDNAGTITINDIDNSVHNNMHSNNASSNNENSFNTTIDFDSISSELGALLKEVKISGVQDDVKVIELAQLMATKKDEKGLSNTLKKLSKNTIRIIEVSAAFATLYQFFSSVAH